MKFKTSKKTFMHVDCDSFFAACEVFMNPKLKWKPVCVGWEIVIACTYEAKKVGVKCWTPIWEAKRILWDSGVYLPVNFELYWKLSKKLMAFLKEESISFEKFSIDEAFIDVTWIPEYHKMTNEEYALHLQKRIHKELWIPVSIGIGNTKIRAKILSKVNKPFWVCDWTNLQTLEDVFSEYPIKEIPFVWRASQEKLKYALKTINDFRQSEFWWIKKMMWKGWTDLWLELNWVNTFKLKKAWTPPKSITRTRSFNKHITNDLGFLKSQIILNLERAMEELTAQKMETKTISLYLKTKANEKLLISKTLPEYSLDRREITNTLWELLWKLYSQYSLYRSTGVYFSDLRTHTPKQLSLMEMTNENFEKSKRLEGVIEKMNKKFGKGVVSVLK